MTPEEIIQEIIKVLRIDGELATDGKCLDMVADLLDKNGYGPVYPCCNHCGEPSNPTTMYHYERLPWPVDSVHAGESGSVCAFCHRNLEEARVS